CSASTQTVEMSTVRPDTSRKINVKPRRSSSSAIIPLKASVDGVPVDHNQIVLITPATMPAREMPPVIQRCVGRTKASTSFTVTAAAQRITSGAINDQLTMGITDCAKKEFIPVDYVMGESVFYRIHKISMINFRCVRAACRTRRNAGADSFHAGLRTIEKRARVNTHEKHQQEQRHQQTDFTLVQVQQTRIL